MSVLAGGTPLNVFTSMDAIACLNHVVLTKHLTKMPLSLFISSGATSLYYPKDNIYFKTFLKDKLASKRLSKVLNNSVLKRKGQKMTQSNVNKLKNHVSIKTISSKLGNTKKIGKKIVSRVTSKLPGNLPKGSRVSQKIVLNTLRRKIATPAVHKLIRRSIKHKGQKEGRKSKKKYNKVISTELNLLNNFMNINNNNNSNNSRPTQPQANKQKTKFNNYKNQINKATTINKLKSIHANFKTYYVKRDPVTNKSFWIDMGGGTHKSEQNFKSLQTLYNKRWYEIQKTKLNNYKQQINKAPNYPKLNSIYNNLKTYYLKYDPVTNKSFWIDMGGGTHKSEQNFKFLQTLYEKRWHEIQKKIIHKHRYGRTRL